MTYKTGGIADAGPAIIIGLLIGLIAAQLVGTSPKPTNAQQAASFDHSGCQYPDRWSNPVDGCDNSDPAVPECIKAFSTKEGEDACIAAFVDANSVNGTNNASQTPQNIPLTPAPTQAVQCGGK